MRHGPLATSFVAALLGASLWTDPTLAGPVIRQIDEERVRVVDYSGKPPFRRQIVRIDELNAAQFARFEETAREASIDRSRLGERVRVVNYRGKPPFQRRTVTIDESNVAQFARFEETIERQPPRRRGPFGKWPSFVR
jgi:hypothetical protein